MSYHIPVLAKEVIEGLEIKPTGVYIDGTAGGGGHSALILEKLNGGTLYCIDRDPDAIAAVTERLTPITVNNTLKIIQSNYSEIADIITEKADGILLDCGISSYQIDIPARGFSYHTDSPLDMRMEKSGKSAYDIINEYSKEDLSRILYLYGEEKFAGKIAANIVKNRPINSTLELSQVISAAVPFSVKRDKNPSKKTFQAVRIETNSEMEHLKKGLRSAFEVLKSGGILTAISFHSIEDRLIKQIFTEFSLGCCCPKNFPVCVCGKTAKGLILTKKPILPTEEELTNNKRSHSAKLRIIKKL